MFHLSWQQFFSFVFLFLSFHVKSYAGLECKPKINTLVESILRPHQQGITLQMIEDAYFEDALMNSYMSAVTIVQVIDSQIYFDDRTILGAHDIEKQRFHTFLTFLADYLDRRESNCTLYNNNNTVNGNGNCTIDFEFVLDVKDCQCGWKEWNKKEDLDFYWQLDPSSLIYKGLSKEESVERYAKLPIMTLTKCNGRNSIPIPQWYPARDGPFDAWDKFMKNSRSKVIKSPYKKRANKATFYGVLASYSSYDVEGVARPTRVTDANWHQISRMAIQFQSWIHPDLINCGINANQDYEHEYIGKWGFGMNDRFVSLERQLAKHRHVISTEGWCGWADRLKKLLHLDATILLQESPCKEYYTLMLEPGVHYIPVDGTFSNLADQINWAITNEDEARKIAENAGKFAQDYLSQESISCYMDLLFSTYASLLNYKPLIRNDSRKWNRSDPIE